MLSPLTSDRTHVLLRLAAVVLAIAAIGLPVNDPFRITLLGLAIVTVCVGDISRRLELWAAALAVAVVAALGPALWPAPRIEEGHNVFLFDEGRSGALERGLPADAFRFMAAEFDARYPPDKRCEPRTAGCWRGQPFPDRTFAFAADGIYQRPVYSRRVAHIGFFDPVWLRLGFINDDRYNWYGATDVEREGRIRGLASVLEPWQLRVPYFLMYRFPAEFAGSWLCWQGTVLWEGEGERFTVWQHRERSCRPVEAADIGRRIFGVSIAAPLAITLEPTLAIQLRRLAQPGFALLGVLGLLALLLRWHSRQFTLPFVLIGLSLSVVVLNDISFIGGVRPFNGGDDGLFYEGVGRRILQHLLAGDYALALEGGEKVYYYGGPGLRYFRALEHLVFGDSFYGYLFLILLLPFLVFALVQRFFSAPAALAFTLVFIAVPVGALFGTSYFHYVKWGARGFADPAAAVSFIAGLLVLIGRTAGGPGARFAPAVGAGLLFALALWIRPNLSPGAAVLLGGAGLLALWRGQWARLAGLCLGFLPVFGMALHNWYFGGVFVLFSSNITAPANFPMPPSVYVAALGDLLRLDLASGNPGRVVTQIAAWLAGPSESYAMIPLHIAAIAVLVRVGMKHGGEIWLRLMAGAALALHSVALFYAPYDRYHYVAWFLTLLACAVWVCGEGIALARRYAPRLVQRAERHPAVELFWRALERASRAMNLGAARPR